MAVKRKRSYQQQTGHIDPAIISADVDPSEFGYLSPPPFQRKWKHARAEAVVGWSAISPTALVGTSSAAAMEWKSTMPDLRFRRKNRTTRLSPFWHVGSIPNLAPGARTGHISTHVTYDGFLSANPKYSGWVSCHASQP